ncbi:hypothetical protein ACIGFK_38635 [Streptomyces sp. NPDC085524]|uniref:hypothetical protein n=1 Tax=unclassified Streptomyces TaxID=2593676 RepID=UPI0035E0C1DC
MNTAAPAARPVAPHARTRTAPCTGTGPRLRPAAPGTTRTAITTRTAEETYQ